MDGNKAEVGTFEFLDDTLHALELAKKNSKDFRVYSPCPLHEIAHAASPKRSPIGYITGLGAVTGTCFGFTLCIWTALDWPIRVSAKPIVSIPAFIPVGYETTILLGAIITLISLFHFCRLPDIFRAPGYNPRLSQDRFGLVVFCEPSETAEIADSLKKFGAEEVNITDGL